MGGNSFVMEVLWKEAVHLALHHSLMEQMNSYYCTKGVVVVALSWKMMWIYCCCIATGTRGEIERSYCCSGVLDSETEMKWVQDGSRSVFDDSHSYCKDIHASGK